MQSPASFSPKPPCPWGWEQWTESEALCSKSLLALHLGRKETALFVLLSLFFPFPFLKKNPTKNPNQKTQQKQATNKPTKNEINPQQKASCDTVGPGVDVIYFPQLLLWKPRVDRAVL